MSFIPPTVGGAATVIGRGVFVIDADTTGLQRGVNNSSSIVRGFATTVRGAGITIANFGKDTVRAVGGIVGAFIEFEDAMVGVRKTIDETEEGFERIEKGLISMSLRVPIASADLAELAQIAGQLGVRGVDNILKFTEVASQMGVATNLSAASAATALAQISTVMDLPIDSIDNLGAAIVDLGNKTAANESTIVNSLSNISGIGATLDIPVENLVGIAATLGAVRISAQKGGSAVSRAFLEMAKAAIEGDDALTAFAFTMGLSNEAAAELIETDPTSALLRFLTGLDLVKEGGGDWIAILEETSLNNIRTRDTTLRLAAAHEELRKNLNLGVAAFEKGTALQIEFDKAIDTLGADIQILRNNLFELWRTLGVTLAPTVSDLTDRVSAIVDSIRDWVNANPQLAKTIVLIVAGIGALATVLGTLLVIAAVVQLSLLLFGTGPLVILVGGFLAAVAAGALMIIFWEELVQTLDDIGRAIGDFGGMIGDVMGIATSAVGGFLNAVKDAVDEALDVIRFFRVEIGVMFDAIATFASSVGAFIQGLVTSFFSIVEAIFEIGAAAIQALNPIVALADKLGELFGVGAGANAPGFEDPRLRRAFHEIVGDGVTITPEEFTIRKTLDALTSGAITPDQFSKFLGLADSLGISAQTLLQQIVAEPTISKQQEAARLSIAGLSLKGSGDAFAPPNIPAFGEFPSFGDDAAKLSPIERAMQATAQRRFEEQLEGLFTGGVSGLEATILAQQEMELEWIKFVEQAKDAGLAITELNRAMWERMREDAEDGTTKIEGLLAFLIAREVQETGRSVSDFITPAGFPDLGNSTLIINEMNVTVPSGTDPIAVAEAQAEGLRAANAEVGLGR